MCNIWSDTTLFTDQLCLLQGLVLEIDEDIAPDDDDREALQEIVNNVKLSEGYLALARDIEVMEPKSPEDIYKVLVLIQLSKLQYALFLLR